ncbi:MAG: hypothetical protein WAX07_04695 [Candidatus Altiarchaeia archaeon]
MESIFPGKKGQTALEYLMTYGWMLLIISVVAVVLWQMGILDRTVPHGTIGFSQMKPLDWKASNSERTLTLTLTNDAGTKITLQDVNVTTFTNTCSVNGLNQELSAAEALQVIVPDCDFPEPGEYYKAEIIIVYQNVASAIDHNSVGECHGPVEA